MLCSEGCLRITCYVLQIICFITGAVILALGVWGVLDNSLAELIKGDSSVVAGLYIFIIAGAIIVWMSMFGCFSIRKEKKRYVIIYCIIVLLAIFLKVVGCILIFDYFVTQHESLQESYKDLYGKDDNEGITKVWDQVQESGMCCGLIDYRDWEESYFYKANRNRYPLSCCMHDKKDLPADLERCTKGSENYIYIQGCDGFIKKFYYGIGFAAVAIILIELFAVVFLACLYQHYP